MAESKTTVCNMALARLGAKRINDYDDSSDTSLEAIYCRLFFDQTLKAHLKDHIWPFAKKRQRLSAYTEWSGSDTSSDFQYDYAYHLPNDYIRGISFWNGSDQIDGKTSYSYEFERGYLLTDESAVYLKYIAYISDVGYWDSLFIESFVLLLAKKLVVPLAMDLNIKADIDRDLAVLMQRIRAMDRQEEKRIGRNELKVWRDARYSDYA